MAENEWLNKDFYKVLGVSKDATTDEIGSLTGKVGQLPNVTVKATLAKV